MPPPGFPYPLPDPFGFYCSAHTLILRPPGVTGLPQPCPWTRPSPPALPTSVSLQPAQPPPPGPLLPTAHRSCFPWGWLLSFRPHPQPSSPAHFQDPHSLPFTLVFPQTRSCSLVLLPPFLVPIPGRPALLFSPLNLPLHPGSLCPLPHRVPCLASSLPYIASLVCRPPVRSLHPQCPIRSSLSPAPNP